MILIDLTVETIIITLIENNKAIKKDHVLKAAPSFRAYLFL